MTTILTLQLDPRSQDRFEALRRMHFPPERNIVPAHVTLFHALPDMISHGLAQEAAHQHRFSIQWTGLRSLGRGVAYVVEASELLALHRRLGDTFREHLSRQDRQAFHPHLVVQNKSTPDKARALLAELQQRPLPEPSCALGLHWWEYLGGPWRPIRTFAFQ